MEIFGVLNTSDAVAFLNVVGVPTGLPHRGTNLIFLLN